MQHPHQSWRALYHPPAVFLVCSLPLAALTIVSWNFFCWHGCALLPISLWQWIAPIKFSGLLVLASVLLLFRHPLAYLAAILLSAYAIYDVSLGLHEQWREYSSVGLQGTALWKIVLWQSLLPVWKGLLRFILGVSIICYATARFIRRVPAV